MSVATALARSRMRSTSTISRQEPRSTRDRAPAETTAPAPMFPTFMVGSSNGCCIVQDPSDDGLPQLPDDEITPQIGPTAPRLLVECCPDHRHIVTAAVPGACSCPRHHDR